MAKRFIDTGIFDDDWFMDQSKDGKIFWLYLITKCDHAGIIKINEKLCKVQTGINDIQTLIKGLGNRLIRVSEHLYFIPKFIEFQYPGFPNSKVRQQQSAVDILKKHGLWDSEKLTLNKELDNSYGSGSGSDTGNEHEPVINYSGILENFHLYCDRMSKVAKLTDERKKHIAARFKEYDYDTIIEVLARAGRSDFLCGEGGGKWQANFDWIFNPTNFAKIIEGRYDNKVKPKEKILMMP